jgi:lipopolysaccharide/colanic/teichoic acid biosynthesis glycosyltransferase
LYKSFFKPLIDKCVAIGVLSVTSPFFILATISLWFANSGKPFFFQARPGRNGRIFKIYKFKTMNDKKDKNGNLLPDSERLTPVGRFLRKTSFDEIPQLINVLTGDMSLIGPRPLLLEYLPLYSPEQMKRHEVKPGITGWAQVNGRNLVQWSQRLEMDAWYAENVSFLLDMKIAWLTVKKTVAAEGVSSKGSETMEKFKGETIS